MLAVCARFWGLIGSAIEDNFFALGGDSIISIQLVSRARQAGLAITPRAVFQHQTVEALAGAAGAVGSGLSTGSRHRDWSRAAHADHLLAVGGRRADRMVQSGDAASPAGGYARRTSDDCLAEPARSSRCVAAAVAWRAAAGGSGGWRLRRLARLMAGDCLRRIEVCGLSDEGLRGLHCGGGAAAERRLAPAAGTMLQAVWFDAGAR